MQQQSASNWRERSFCISRNNLLIRAFARCEAPFTLPRPVFDWTRFLVERCTGVIVFLSHSLSVTIFEYCRRKVTFTLSLSSPRRRTVFHVRSTNHAMRMWQIASASKGYVFCFKRLTQHAVEGKKDWKIMFPLTRFAAKRVKGLSNQRSVLGHSNQQSAVLVQPVLVLQIVAFLSIESCLFTQTTRINKTFAFAITRTPSLYKIIDLRWNVAWFGNPRVTEQLIHLAGSQLQDITIGVSMSQLPAIHLLLSQTVSDSLRVITNLGKAVAGFLPLIGLLPWIDKRDTSQKQQWLPSKFSCGACNNAAVVNNAERVLFCWGCSKVYCCAVPSSRCKCCMTDGGSSYYVRICANPDCVLLAERLFTECDTCSEATCPHCIRQCSTCPRTSCAECWSSNEGTRCRECTFDLDANFC